VDVRRGRRQRLLATAGPVSFAHSGPEPLADAGPEPVAQPGPQPVADPGPEPVAYPVADPGPEPVADPGPEPVAYPGPEPLTRSRAVPLADAGPEAITESAAETSCESPTGSESIAEPPPEPRAGPGGTGRGSLLSLQRHVLDGEARNGRGRAPPRRLARGGDPAAGVRSVHRRWTRQLVGFMGCAAVRARSDPSEA
jgi:hypothetical protein